MFLLVNRGVVRLPVEKHVTNTAWSSRLEQNEVGLSSLRSDSGYLWVHLPSASCPSQSVIDILGAAHSSSAISNPSSPAMDERSLWLEATPAERQVWGIRAFENRDLCSRYLGCTQVPLSCRVRFRCWVKYSNIINVAETALPKLHRFVSLKSPPCVWVSRRCLQSYGPGSKEPGPPMHGCRFLDADLFHGLT